MTRPQPSHEIRKLTIVLPAHVVDALRSQLGEDETVTDCIKRLVTREALGVGLQMRNQPATFGTRDAANVPHALNTAPATRRFDHAC